jgi:hypothetical protein
MNKKELEEKILEAIREYEKANPERGVDNVYLRKAGKVLSGEHSDGAATIGVECSILQYV